ncbi:MAG TPA: hypothetical protein VGN20_04815 [Mucilaginibacter sp.]|jgi:hypothetical protein
MKKLFLLIVLSILLFNVSKAQTAWINYKIDNKLSIKVPSEPAKTDEYSVTAQGTDTLVCVISIIDLKKIAGIDSATLATMAPTNEFTSSIKTGMLGKMEGYTLGDFKTSKWNGYYCYNVEGGNATTKVKLYTFMVIIGTNIYSLSAVMPDHRSTKDKDDFFASLALN